MASSNYQPLTHSGFSGSPTDLNGSLQPCANSTAINVDPLEDAGYYSIESYNKNTIDSIKEEDKTTNEYTRSTSPIPVLLRSASSILSRSMRLPPGSLRASTLTVITSMTGGGTFTFSYGIYKSGMISGIIYLFILSSLTAYTTHCLVYCAERNNCPSFRSLAHKLYGNKVAIFIQISLCLMLWMACISYATLTKNLLYTAISSFCDFKINNILLISIAAIIPTYLALQRKVSALRYASLFGLMVVIFCVILVVIKYIILCKDIINITTDPGYQRECKWYDSDHYHRFNSDIMDHSYTIALFFGGFAAQFTILPIYFEMQKRSPRNMTKCIASGFGITCFIYLIVAYFGYWTFPNLIDPKQDQNLITLYSDDTVMLVAQILLAIYVMSIIPLFGHAFRKSINELIQSRFVSHGSDEIDDDSVDSIDINHLMDEDIIDDAILNAHLAYIPISPEAKKHHRERSTTVTNDMELPTFYHALLTVSFLVSVFAVALFADNIGQVNSIISTTILPIVGFIFPAACALRTDGASLRMKVLTCFTAIVSVLNATVFFYNMFTSK